MSEIGKFHNKYHTGDDVLDTVYAFNEGDTALGGEGAQAGITLPTNYCQESVRSEVPGTGISGVHSNYMGIQDASGELFNDGAINRVVDDWMLEPNHRTCEQFR